MKKIKEDIIHFFQHQGYVIVTTLDPKGLPHTACKGIVHIAKTGKIYLLDVFKGQTYHNLRKNPFISITSVDEHRYKGYCLKGTACMVCDDDVRGRFDAAWKEKLTRRVSNRIIRSVRGEKGHASHPEMALPNPEYIIAMEITEIVDLAPRVKK